MDPVTKITFVSPLHNEEENVQELYSRIKKTAESLNCNFDIVIVNDGSTDSTLQILQDIREQDKRLKIVTLSRNFGQQVAVAAGIRYAKGDCVALLDGDLQDPPEVVADMFDKWKQGYKVIYGIRKNRKENLFLRFSYSLFYYCLNKVSKIDIPRDVGDFCLMDMQVVTELIRINEYKPFLRGLRAWVGFRQTGVEYDRPCRHAGKSKYSIAHLYQLALDGFMSFSDVFLLLASIIGCFISGISFVFGSWIVTNRILIHLNMQPADSLVPGWTTLVCLLAFLVGLQFIYMGLLGKYIGRIFMHTKGRPLFVVEKLEGFDEPQII